jgi:hypothetical protein
VRRRNLRERMMGAEQKPVGARRVLHLRIRTRSSGPAELFSFLKAAVPFYESIGCVRVRLLRNIDDPTRYIEVIEYEDLEAFEKDQLRVANDPQMHGYLEVWRSLLSGGVEVETYEDVTGSI